MDGHASGRGRRPGAGSSLDAPAPSPEAAAPSPEPSPTPTGTGLVGILPGWARRTLAWAVFAIVVGLLAVGLLRVLVSLQVLLVPVLAALLGLALVGRAHDRLVGRGLPRTVAALLATAILLVVVGTAVTALATTLAATWGDIRADVVDGARRIDLALPVPSSGSGATGEVAPLATLARDLTSAADRSVVEVSQGLLDGVSFVAQVAAGTFLVLALVYHLLRDGPRLWRGALPVVATVSGTDVATAREVSALAFRALAAYVRGSAFIALIDASLVWIALVVLDVPRAPGLAALVFLGAFVPYVGAVVSGSIAVLSALSTVGTGSAAAVAGVVVLVQAFDATVLQPWIQGRSVHLHPAVVLLALTAGATLAGVVGTLVSVPVAALVQMAFTRRVAGAADRDRTGSST